MTFAPARDDMTFVPRTAARHTVRIGVPAPEIAAHASRLKADLVVVGRGAGRPLRDSFLGSTAERVIRLGRAPIVAVSNTTTSERSDRNSDTGDERSVRRSTMP